MKIKAILVFLVISNIISAQNKNDKTIYLDSTYVATDVENHAYYRIVKDYKLEKPEYEITQYYNSGEKESEGISTSKDFLKQKGTYISYYKNGNKKISINYDNDGNKDGYCTGFYENGEKKFEGVFLKSKIMAEGFERTVSKLKITNYWNKDKIQTVTNGNGDYTDDGYFDNLNKFSVSSGKLADGFKEGTWSGTNDNLGFTFTENYANGKLIDGKSIDKNGIEHPYTEVDVLAKATGGMKAFYQYVAKNFKTPEDLQGVATIVTKFTVTTDNQITDIKNIRSVSKEADEEAIRVIVAFNDFMSAAYRGIAVRSTFTFPIRIQSAE